MSPEAAAHRHREIPRQLARDLDAGVVPYIVWKFSSNATMLGTMENEGSAVASRFGNTGERAVGALHLIAQQARAALGGVGGEVEARRVVVDPVAATHDCLLARTRNPGEPDARRDVVGVRADLAGQRVWRVGIERRAHQQLVAQPHVQRQVRTDTPLVLGKEVDELEAQRHRRITKIRRQLRVGVGPARGGIDLTAHRAQVLIERRDGATPARGRQAIEREHAAQRARRLVDRRLEVEAGLERGRRASPSRCR